MKSLVLILGVFLLMVAIGVGIATIFPVTAQAGGNCPEVPPSNCFEPCMYFDEPLTLCTQSCECYPYIDLTEYYTACKRCNGLNCWVYAGCCSN